MRRVFASQTVCARVLTSSSGAHGARRFFATVAQPSSSLFQVSETRMRINNQKSANIFVQTRGMAKGASKEVVQKSKVDQPRNDLLDALSIRVAEVKGYLEEGEAGGLEQTGYKLSKKEDGTVTLTREVEGYKVAINFNPNEAYIPDENEAQGEGAEGEEGEGGVPQQAGAEGEAGEGEEGFGDQLGAEPFLAFDVEVQSLKNPSGRALTVDADIDVYGQVHVNGFRFGGESRDGSTVDVTQEVAKGLEDFVTQLGIDSELTAYLWSFCRVHHDKNELSRLQELHKFFTGK